MNRRRYLWAGSGVALIVTLVFAHEGHKAITTKGVMFGPKTSKLLMEPPARKAVGLATARVDFATIEETLRVPARVDLAWSRKAFASARIAGIIESIRVKPGERVRAGDVLAEITSMELDSLQLELTHRAIEKRLAEENLKRARDLGERLVAGREILQLETDVQDKDNAIRILREKLAAIGLSEEQLRALSDQGESAGRLAIEAPIGGTIVHVDTAIGAAVEPNRHLVEIHDSASVLVEAHVPESRAAGVRPGMDIRMTFAAYPGRVFPGKVERLGAEVSEDRTVSAWATIENADLALKPGQYGRMEIVLGMSESAFAAPVEAIVEDGAEKYAVVVDKENTFVRVDKKAEIEDYAAEQKPGYVAVNAYVKRNVVVGRSDGRLVEILEGLYPGDVVVTAASHELSALYVQGTLKLSDEARKNMRLATEEVDLGTIEDIVRLNVALRLPVDRSAFASSRIDGKILKIHAAPGQEIKRGDVLAEVHSLELDNLQIEYRAAHLRERLLRALLEQLRTLASSGITPRKDLLQLETDHRTQLSTLLSLRRRLAVLGFTEAQLEELGARGQRLPALPVTSPIAGRVVDVDVVVGQVVKPEDHLFRIADARTLWAEAKVFEGDFAKVVLGEAGKEVTIRLAGLPGREISARVSFAAQSMGYHEKILPIFAELKNDDESLRPGMIGEMLVVVGRPEKRVIAVPNRALLSVGGQTVAFVETGKTFKRVPVEVGRRDARYAEAIKGLFPGDKVAVSGVNELNTAIMSLK